MRGAQPFQHAGGVGALYGFRNESGVAILPTDRDTAADRERRVGALGTGFGTGATAGAGTQDFATTHSNSNPFAENTTPGFASNMNTNSNQGFAANTNPNSNPFATNTTPGFAANMDTNPNQAPVLSRTHDRSNPGIGESEDMAERARAAGAEKARDMTAHTTSTQDARTSTGTPARTEKQRGNDNAAAIGAAAGVGEMQKHEQKEEKKQRGNESAAAVGAAVGVGEMQKHEQKEEQKQRGNESAAAIGAAAGVGEMQKHERNEAPAAAPAQKHTQASHANKVSSIVLVLNLVHEC